MSINKVIVTGHLTRDPELRATSSGTLIMNFGIAVNDRRRNNQTGEWEDYPNFINCVMFGNRAEAVSRYISKGSKVAIEGKLRYSNWEKDGQKRSKIEIIVDEIEFMSTNNSNNQPMQASNYQQQAYAKPAPAPAPVPQNTPQQAYYDAEIPF